MCHVSHVTCHVSDVTCHVSPVTCHLSHVRFFFILKKTLLSGGASRWRVCYQRGLPRLVLSAFPPSMWPVNGIQVGWMEPFPAGFRCQRLVSLTSKISKNVQQLENSSRQSQFLNQIGIGPKLWQSPSKQLFCKIDLKQPVFLIQGKGSHPEKKSARKKDWENLIQVWFASVFMQWARGSAPPFIG